MMDDRERCQNAQIPGREGVGYCTRDPSTVPIPTKIPTSNVPIVHSSPTIPHFSTSTMSTKPSTSTPHSNFVHIFDAALEAYKHKTKEDLASHLLLPLLESCDSPEAILTVLREQIPGFSESQDGDDGLTKWVTPTVNVLYAFSDTLGQGIGLVSIKIFPCN